MAIVRGHYLKSSTSLCGRVKEITFTGTATLSGVGVSRLIKGYRVPDSSNVYETESGPDGVWSLNMRGGKNDEFRIICVGSTGENSEIYEHLME